jgi:hypothetical protein
METLITSSWPSPSITRCWAASWPPRYEVASVCVKPADVVLAAVLLLAWL